VHDNEIMYGIKIVEGNKLCDTETDLRGYAETKNYADIYVGVSPAIMISYLYYSYP
jgi:hypothetical protein